MSNKTIKNRPVNSNDIIIDDGTKTYNIKNRRGQIIGKFTFNPSEIEGIIERYEHAVSTFQKIQESINSDDDIKNAKIETDKLKDEIDLLFNADVSGTFFKITTPLSLLESGEIYVVHIIDTIRSVIESETGKRLVKAKSRASKYTQKYNK